MALVLKDILDREQLVAKLKSVVRVPRPTAADLVLAAGAVSLVIVCLGLLGVPAFHRLQLRAKAAAVTGNAATLQLAAETYAAAHQGRYATDGLDLLPYLPENSTPLNPYTAEPLIFRRSPGDVTYRSPTRGSDYVIQAFAMGPQGKPRLVKTLRGRPPQRF